MFHNLLIGVDGRQGGRDAIALAHELAGHDARLTLAHVELASVGTITRLDQVKSEQLLNDERETAAPEAKTVRAVDSTVGRGLHELADELGADLIVVGSTHHALLGRILLGDNCLSALNGSSCALAVATRGYAEMAHGPRRIGVGYDGSAESEQALAAAREIATLHQARLSVFHVVSLSEVSQEKPLPADWPETIQTMIERDTERLARLPGVTAAVTYGGPGEELVQFGGAVDLMVVGSRGHGPLGRLFHGSIARYLVQHAKCPVLVLPRATAEQSQAESSAGAGCVSSSPA